MSERGGCSSENLKVRVGVLRTVVISCNHSVHSIEIASKNRRLLLSIDHIDIDTVEEATIGTDTKVLRRIPRANDRLLRSTNTIVSIDVFRFDIGSKLGRIGGSDTVV